MLVTTLSSSFDNSAMASMQQQQHQQNGNNAAQVAEKVMRRIEIAKVARNLQDCLAFASFKAQNGWQDRTLSTIEPEITEKLARRKRPFPQDLHISDASSTLSEDLSSSSSTHTVLPSNPAQSYADSRKRVRASSSSALERDGISVGWRQNNGNAQSSPVIDRPPMVETSHPSLQDSPMFDAPSTPDIDDQENGMSSMQEPSSSIISSSPPRTPPPARRNLTKTKYTGTELLLYLTDTPQTPAVHVQHISSTSKNPPSTPPHQHGSLPSSLMQTPGNLGLFSGALQTPGNFNLADFCNVTPSPAQTQFNRHDTPGLSRTPCRSTRRNLNFDALAPPSPSASRKTSQGLALQLGDEISR